MRRVRQPPESCGKRLSGGPDTRAIVLSAKDAGRDEAPLQRQDVGEPHISDRDQHRPDDHQGGDPERTDSKIAAIFYRGIGAELPGGNILGARLFDRVRGGEGVCCVEHVRGKTAQALCRGGMSVS